MRLRLNFSTDEMVGFLRAHGLNVEREEAETLRYNDEWVDPFVERQLVWAVRSGVNDYCRPQILWGPDEWLEAAFAHRMKEKLLAP